MISKDKIQPDFCKLIAEAKTDCPCKLDWKIGCVSCVVVREANDMTKHSAVCKVCQGTGKVLRFE